MHVHRPGDRSDLPVYVHLPSGAFMMRFLASDDFTPRLLDLSRRTYFSNLRRRSEPYASPALAEDPTGVCPALMVIRR